MDTLDAIAGEHRPIDHETREAVLDAVHAAAIEHGGRVTIATIRPHLPAWARTQSLGAFISALVRKGVLVWTGEITTNGNAKQRNNLRPAKVYRYVPEAVAP